MKLFQNSGLEIIRIDDKFPMFFVESLFNKEMKSIYFHGFEYGWGNGYVGLPDWHPFYKINYEDIKVECHGGLTFSQLDEDENLWIIGFDTNHFGDDLSNCSFDFVKNETYRLMEQCYNYKNVPLLMRINKLKKIMNL